MKSERKYQTPAIEIIEVSDDIIAASNVFGEEADDTVIWPGN